VVEQGKGMPALSPLAIHFGHYIVGVCHPLITFANAIIAAIPLLTGYPHNTGKS